MGARLQGKTQARGLVAAAGAVVLLLLILLVSASYAAGGALLAGAAASFAVILGLRFVRAAGPAARRIALGLALAAVAALALLVVARLLSGEKYYMIVQDYAIVHSYTVTVRPATTQAGSFAAVEEASLEIDPMMLVSAALPPTMTTPIRLPATRNMQTVTATARGWLLREVTLQPLADARLALPGGAVIEPVLQAAPAAKITVKLQDLPKGSFYAARAAGAVSVAAYLDSETVTWTPSDLGDSITFSYIPAPFHLLRPILAPFITLSSFSQWLLGLLGIVTGTVFSGLVSQPITRRLQESVAALSGRPPARRSSPDAVGPDNSGHGNSEAGNSGPGNRSKDTT